MLSFAHCFLFQKPKLIKTKCVAGDAAKRVGILSPPSMSVGEFGAAAFKQAAKSDARFAECAAVVEIDGVSLPDETNMWEACSGAEDKIVVYEASSIAVAPGKRKEEKHVDEKKQKKVVTNNVTMIGGVVAQSDN